MSSTNQKKQKKTSDKTQEEVASLKERLNSDSSKKKSKKKRDRKTLSEAEIAEKKRLHSEKIVKKQEARLSQHIERVKNKEAKGQPANKERFYVTNAKLLNELYIWKNSAPEKRKDERIITEEFGKMIKMIAERLTNHSNFKNYPRELKQDMVSYACFKCIQGIRNYNFEYRNAFAYFTTACYNAFVSTISKYYKDKNLTRDLTRRAIEKLEATADINSSKILNQFVKEYLGEEFLETTAEDQEDGKQDL